MNADVRGRREMETGEQETGEQESRREESRRRRLRHESTQSESETEAQDAGCDHVRTNGQDPLFRREEADMCPPDPSLQYRER